MFGAQERILFARQLSTFLASGMPLLTALDFMQETERNKGTVFIITSLAKAVSAGRALADALNEFPRHFDHFTITLIRMGESSGTLADSLEHAGLTLKKQRTVRQKALSALIYPGIIVISTIGICIMLTTYAFPKIVPLFEGFKSELPFSTRLLIKVSNFTSDYGLYVFMGIIILISVFWWAQRYEHIQRAREKFLYAIPLLGRVFKAHALTSLGHVLSTLVANRVQLMPALALAAEASPSLLYREVLIQAVQTVRAGGKISDAFKSQTRLIPLSCIQLLSTGEATGTLHQSLSIIERMYEEELEQLSKDLATLIEPVLMIVIGLMVGFIALAIITPVYQITQDVGIR
ncbi:MAG: type secretion system domain, type pilus assembly protein PilC [Parcubacteria group bacterium]|nr:type secretion system domain, type pilus assembly protein PilC [Parcubacteria group bacterium]